MQLIKVCTGKLAGQALKQYWFWWGCEKPLVLDIQVRIFPER